jgi:late competence protein required for DNA uptake (superfamily II DNA/RNA helicase)
MLLVFVLNRKGRIGNMAKVRVTKRGRFHQYQLEIAKVGWQKKVHNKIRFQNKTRG